MLHAMKNRPSSTRSTPSGLPGALALAFALAPFAYGCDALTKKDAADAAVVATPAPAVTPPVTPAAADPAPAATPVAPLGAAAPTPAGGAKSLDGGKPADGGTVALDGGKPVDAGAVDGGKTAPTPTPAFTIPTAIPGFDAGAFKPPAGFPSTLPTTLPTFPPPAK